MYENAAIRLKILSVALLLTPWMLRSADGQVPADSSGGPSRQDGASAPALEIGFSLDANSRLGGLTYVPEEWGEFLLRLENRGDTAAQLLCTSYFDGLPSVQFGRKVWLPPESRLLLSHPVLFPAADRIPDGSATVVSLLIDDSQEPEVLLKSASGQLQRDRTFLVSDTGRHTGVMAGWKSTDVVPQDVVDLITAVRVYQGLNNKLTYLAGQFLPADETSLNYLDHLVLAEDRLVDDLAALAAVRRWLHAGGRLWIMLDRTGPLLLERLFGDEFEGFLVDRAGLTSVRVDDPPTAVLPDGVQGETIEYDQPVALSRLVASEMSVWNTVNGWPAALTRTWGEGRVLITTLGPRGWMTPAAAVRGLSDGEEVDDRRPLDMRSDFVPLSPMEDLAPFIFARRDAAPLPQETLASFAQEFISYEVPTGSLIIGSMFAFVILLAATGTGLWKWGRLEHFGWCGSLLAILFGAGFLSIGLSSRHATPETMASVQFAQAVGGTDDVRTRAAIAVYRPEGGEALINTSEGSRFPLNMTGQDGSTTRMVMTDLGTYQWEGLSQPPGLRMYPVVKSGTSAERLSAHASLNAQGIVGSCADKLAGGANAVLATRRGRMNVQLSGDGTFTAGSEDVMDPDQYLGAAFLDDVQDRRRRILQRLFGNRQWQTSLSQPQLLLWVNAWDHGIDFGEGLQRQGDTLLSVPVELSRPSSGTEVLIPSPLLDYASRYPPDGTPAAGFWDDGRQEWQERSRPSTTWLNVQVPTGLLPLRATRLHLEIGVSGLMGQIEVLGVRNGAVVSVQSVIDPVGTVVIDIDDPETLTIAEDGGLPLGLSAGLRSDADSSETASAAGGTGNPTTPSANTSFNADAPSNYWRIESLSVQLRGITTELAEED